MSDTYRTPDDQRRPPHRVEKRAHRHRLYVNRVRRPSAHALRTLNPHDVDAVDALVLPVAVRTSGWETW